ncbi:MAG TPA: hypothetical protein DHV02_04335 [Neisseriales bacterium]|nr:hypothetical protein [Neisseriales bacterium]
MKKILVSLTAVSICLVACGKESDFKKAINEKKSKAPVCLSVSSDSIDASYTNDDDLKKLKAKTAGAYVISQDYDENGKNSDYSPEQTKNKFVQLDSLTGAGLLTKSTESLVKYSGWGGKKTNGFYKYTIYTLTDAGKATAAKVETNSMSSAMFGDTGQRIFCYATPEVEKIENFTEADDSGYHVAKVKYSYKYVDVADWINKAGVKEAFPVIAKTLDNPDKTAKINLFKTNNGWSTDF